jgi:hypothetical protein
MIIKREGEIGSACMTPLEGENGLEGTSLTKIERKEKEVRFNI